MQQISGRYPNEEPTQENIHRNDTKQALKVSRIVVEEQAGFKAGRRMINQLFVVRQREPYTTTLQIINKPLTVFGKRVFGGY